MADKKSRSQPRPAAPQEPQDLAVDGQLTQKLLADLPLEPLSDEQYTELRKQSDEYLGAFFFMTWVKDQAVKQGHSPSGITEEAAGQIISATQNLDTDVDDENLHLARALSVGATGDWGRAGKLFRSIIWNGAVTIKTEELAAQSYGLPSRASKVMSGKRLAHGSR